MNGDQEGHGRGFDDGRHAGGHDPEDYDPTTLPPEPGARTMAYIQNLQTQLDALFDRVALIEQSAVDQDGEILGSTEEDLGDQARRSKP